MDSPHLQSIRRATSGFIAWGIAWAALIMCFVWSLCDEDTLHYVGLTYYPDRYWAAALPSILCMVWTMYLTLYFISYIRNTRPLTDMHCLTDTDAKGAKPTLGSLAEVTSSVPPISDIPVSVSSKVLHQPWQ